MKRSPVLLIVLAVIVILFFWGCNQQRGLATADQNVQTAWSNVETNYQRRTDLYSSVVKTIQGSANFEKSTLTAVIEARSKATSVHVDVNDSAVSAGTGPITRLIQPFDGYCRSLSRS